MKKYALLLLLTAAPINTADQAQQKPDRKQTVLEALSKLQGSVGAPANPPADAEPKKNNCDGRGCACSR